LFAQRLRKIENENHHDRTCRRHPGSLKALLFASSCTNLFHINR
jgi:hypothetical protein